MADCSEEDWTKYFCSLDLHQIECDLVCYQHYFLPLKLALQVTIKQLFKDLKGKSLICFGAFYRHTLKDNCLNEPHMSMV